VPHLWAKYRYLAVVSIPVTSLRLQNKPTQLFAENFAEYSTTEDRDVSGPLKILKMPSKCLDVVPLLKYYLAKISLASSLQCSSAVQSSMILEDKVLHPN